ncbi:MAG: hypothetical protein ABSC23_12630 [Bryobacteraceae bacterium]|jgi:hypothetical protein
MPKSRLSAALSLLFVFVSGALLGGLAYRAYIVSRPAASPAAARPSKADWRKHYLTEMHDRLKLDDAQTTQLSKLLDQVDDQMHQLQTKRRAEDQASPQGVRRRAEDQTIQNELVAKINALLRPDQRVLYQELRATREKNRQRREEQMQKGGGSFPPQPSDKK